MKTERPIAERMYADPICTEIIRIVRYEGLTVRAFYEKLEELSKRFDKRRIESAAYHLVTYEGQMTSNPKPLAQVTLRGEVRKYASGLLGLPPEHPWHDAVKNGERIPLPWERPEPKAEEKPEEPKPEKPKKRTRKKKVK